MTDIEKFEKWWGSPQCYPFDAKQAYIAGLAEGRGEREKSRNLIERASYLCLVGNYGGSRQLMERALSILEGKEE